ncbi:MAG: glycerophosphodiester phosphodiesterase [Saprospiraceae bacterium]|nr:glycerophosphodiester phosphodiesterase [Saprospiraceae bacterium]
MTTLPNPSRLLLSLLAVLNFAACKITETRHRPTPSGFDWQGHRGARGLCPENTIPAFLKALEFSQVKTLELDLAVSKDGQLIVSHEPWFNPDICNKPNGDSISKREAETLLIYNMTAREIASYDCGSRGNARFPQQEKQRAAKPVFRDVVKAAREKRTDIRWNIEIKSEPDWDNKRHPAPAEFVRLVVAEIRALQLEKTCTVQSFDPRVLRELHAQAPDLTLAFLIENLDGFDANVKNLGFVPQIYSPYYLMVNKALVKKCREKGMKLIPWTVNDVKSMRRLIKLGVDGLITDYPNLIEKV